MKQIFLALAILLPVCAFAQLTESFNGPDVFSSNPWEGDLTKFVINGNRELQLNAHTSSGKARIYIESSCWKESEWRCTIRSDYQGSMYNYFRIYLWCEKPDMEDPGEAIFIRLGHKNQNVAICYQQSNYSMEVLVEGERVLFDSPTQIDLKVVTEADGICTVYTKSLLETVYHKEGAIQWALQDTPGYFMIGAYYSSDHGRDKYIDDLYIKRYETGQSLPIEPTDTLQSLGLIYVEEINEFELQLTFNEPVQAEYASFVLTDIGEADEVYLSEDETIITLVWEIGREKEKEYQLSYSYLYDYNGEEYEGSYPFVSSLGKQKPVQPFEPKEESSAVLGSVLINEIMADPKGLSELPGTEYIELYNVSGKTLSLKDWVIYYGDKATVLTEMNFPVQGYVVLLRDGRDIYVDEGGFSMPLEKFPAQLANAGKDLRLINDIGVLIDEVVYEKAKSGVSWERNGKEWYLSTDSRGGTPGSKNSNSSSEIENPVIPEETVVDFREIVFNELLPNPYTGGSEYIELYNRSKRDLSLSGLSIATRKADGSLSTRYSLSEITGILNSNGYALLTKDKNGVSDFYLVSSPGAIHELKLPVLANTSSTLVLFRINDDEVIDEIQYSSKWHSAFINDEKGVALERIDPDKETQDQTNWTSASTTAGYGTPGYKNSQYKIEDGGVTGVEVPKYSDLLGFYSILYHLDEPGYSCRAYVFDLSGNRLVEIANNTLLGIEGQLTWDGKTSNGISLKTGLYIFYVELYHVTGRMRTYKKVFLAK